MKMNIVKNIFAIYMNVSDLKETMLGDVCKREAIKELNKKCFLKANFRNEFSEDLMLKAKTRSFL